MTGSKMLHGSYREDGPDKHLRFKGALLREDPENSDNYLAQFDPTHLKEAFGWHAFSKNLFVYLRNIGE